jgi:hypothetical protein
LGHKFSLILSRMITNDESAILQKSGCHGASFATDSLPTDLEVTVTKVDIDDTVSPSLEEAIESALASVKSVEDLSVPGLTVPGLPVEKKADQPGVVSGEVIEDKAKAGDEKEPVEATAKPSTGRARAKRPASGKVGAKKPANGNAAQSADNAKESSAVAVAAD